MTTFVRFFETYVYDNLFCFYEKSFQIFIETHNYNDMAKRWMQNFIYILMIKSQSGAHKTVNQILQEFKILTQLSCICGAI